MGRTCGTCEENINAYRGLVRKPVGKRPFVRPRSRRENNIEMDFKEVD